MSVSRTASTSSRGRGWFGLLLWVCVSGAGGGCGPVEERLAPETSTWAELRTVRRGVAVEPPGARPRPPYPRERLVDGSTVRLEPEALAWLRTDRGATLLVDGPAEFRQRPQAVELTAGRVFVDAPPEGVMEVTTPRLPLTLAAVRASIEVRPDGSVEAYVLAGEVRAGEARARAGERLLYDGTAPRVVPAVAWEDWTGGLATTDRAPEPAPFGVGTVGARRPGEQGNARFPLAIQKLDVKVTFRGDFVVTEVEEVFFNPSSETVEGLYGFRTPVGATLERFGVDREGRIAWGHVKERQSAAAQYQSNVYAGSTEDPALLEWDAPGVYRARLYPIAAGETRRVVVRYSEWLARTGEAGERRVYVYPMAAEGAEESLPHIEELTVKLDLAQARTGSVRVGMAGVRRGNDVLIRAQDIVPRADLSVELFDRGASTAVAYRAKHTVDLESLPREERSSVRALATKEPDYLLVPVRAADVPLPTGGLDLAVVIDASAATDAAALAVARAATNALVAQLGAADRVAVWAGADTLRPVSARSGKHSAVDAALRSEIATGLSRIEPGGATDLGKMLADAATTLDPNRRGAVVYVGDGRPTVGELGLEPLRTRLGKLPHPVRVYALGIGAAADLALLDGLARGGFAVRVEDGYSAARQALAVLEHAERPAWLGATVDLGPTVERVYPRDTSTWVADETVLVVGRISGEKVPDKVRLGGPGSVREQKLEVKRVLDHGDLTRRWATGRLGELLEQRAGHAAMVDLGSRHALITPVTSLYVPTTKELKSDYDWEPAVVEAEAEQPSIFAWLLGGSKSEAPQAVASAEAEPKETVAERLSLEADDKEGGTGTRAKGEEGAMGKAAGGKRYAIQGPKDSPDPEVARAASLREAAEFGMIGALNAGAGGAAPPAASAAPLAPSGNAWGDAIGDSSGAGGLGLSGIGDGGGGRDEGIGLGALGAVGHGAGTGTGQGFGSGHGRLGGAHQVTAPRVRMGAATVSGPLPVEVIQRIVRQNFGRFRMCYEGGLARNPNLEGRVSARFVITSDGSVADVANGGSDLPDSGVVACVIGAYSGLSFPAPDGGPVTVVLPVAFTPGGGAPGPEPSAELPTQVTIQVLPRAPFTCGEAARVTLAERVVIWRERLGQVRNTDAGGVAAVYSRALRQCEAPSFTERARLLALMLDAMGSVRGQVDLWRAMQQHLGAADVLYRGILARARTAAQIRELHVALGLRTVDPGILAKAIKDAPDPAARVKKLRELAALFPDDLALALRLLDALEDAADLPGARELARTLRTRPDADAAVRTAVGELHLRLAARASDAAAKAADLGEAKRAFGEIVEFAPTDPVARRRLGDLLRAHGWFGEARRQYETLAELTPDDASVPLLIAAAAQGEGRLEEAVRWTEKGIGAGAPDVAQGPAATARSFATTFLAWGRLDARSAKRTQELATLGQRARRLLGKPAPTGSARVTLTWVHPDFHPTLWTATAKNPVPAPLGDVTLGLAEAVVAARDGTVLEIRLDPRDHEVAARLGVEAVLTVVFQELEGKERIVRLAVPIERGGPPTVRFVFSGQEVRRG